MKAQIVSFHCVLKNKFGRVISSTYNNSVLTQVTDSEQMLKGLAEALHDLRKGEKRQVVLMAAEAYGFYDPDKVIECELDQLPQGKKRLRTGDELKLKSDDGEVNWFRVTACRDGRLTLDGNHPLAGQDLVFEIVGTEAARDATAEEMRQVEEPESGQKLFH